MMMLPGVGERRYSSLADRPDAAYATLAPYYASLDALPAPQREFLRARVAEQLIETGFGDFTAQTGRTSCTSGMKCLSRFSMPWRSVAVEEGHPEQAPRMCR